MAIITDSFAGAPSDVITRLYDSVDDIPVELYVQTPNDVFRANNASSGEEGIGYSLRVNTSRMTGITAGQLERDNVVLAGFDPSSGQLIHTATGIDCGRVRYDYVTTSGGYYNTVVDGKTPTDTSAVISTLPANIELSTRGVTYIGPGNVFYGDLTPAGAVRAGFRPRTDVNTDGFVFVDNVGSLNEFYVRLDLKTAGTVTAGTNNQFLGILRSSGAGKTAGALTLSDIAIGILTQAGNVRVVVNGAVVRSATAASNAALELQFGVYPVSSPAAGVASDTMRCKYTAVAQLHNAPFTVFFNVSNEGDHVVHMGGVTFASINDADQPGSDKWFTTMTVDGAHGAAYAIPPTEAFWTNRIKTQEII